MFVLHLRLQFNELRAAVAKIVSDLDALQYTVSEVTDHKSVSEQRIVSLEYKGGNANMHSVMGCVMT
jgi:hypothetical protein